MMERERTLVFDDIDKGSFMSVEGSAMEGTPREQFLCPRNAVPPTPAKAFPLTQLPKKSRKTTAEPEYGSPKKKQRSSQEIFPDMTTPSYSQEFFTLPLRQDSDGFMRNDTTNTFQLSYFHSNYRELNELGRGSFGRVVRAKHNCDQRDYAVKISLKPIRQSEHHNKLREARTLAKCTACPYIVRYFNSWIDDANVYLQMELCTEGSVAAILKSTNYSRWPDATTAMLIMHMSLALDYLHSELKLVHLDVKPDNIYKSGPNFKLGDFGLAAPDSSAERMAPLSQTLSQGLSQISFVSFEDGDARYLAIDMLNDKTNPKEADIFSLGLSFYEVVSSVEAPCSGTPEWTAVRETGITEASLTACDYGYLYPLLSSMLDREPSLRPSAKEILRKNAELWKTIPTEGSHETSVHPWVELQKTLFEQPTRE
eukprot:TRINITY_DN9865_c0_g1_i1.p1 TRINITY_DN9865_c0_g1~~TRINITY_DN9865_c0_g1_i1.p1  ORF type:complete len:426 (+),score=46.88 TRINITY_DN9865_c0_g1_i1:96-1373(+)